MTCVHWPRCRTPCLNAKKYNEVKFKLDKIIRMRTSIFYIYSAECSCVRLKGEKSSVTGANMTMYRKLSELNIINI